MARIGLFPLNIVLFPGAAYPLHIFESRYKTLIREVTAEEGEFGINLVESGKMFEVGCRARVTEVTRTYDDGRLDIIVQGTTRYLISGYTTGEKPYITAEVGPLDDEENTTPSYELLEQTIGLYNQLVESVYGDAEELLDPTHWISGGGSFRMAQKCGLELVLRQQLLEMRSETQRLEFLQTYLQDLVPKIKQMETLQMLSRNDGYVKPS
jgi:ATP-dependent Lon protease